MLKNQTALELSYWFVAIFTWYEYNRTILMFLCIVNITKMLNFVVSVIFKIYSDKS